jgi:hydroxypyruvate reductase
LLIRTHNSPGLLDLAWTQRSGGHPVPDRQSLVAGERLAGFLADLPADQPLLVLVSGGGSACCEVPAAGLSLDDLAGTYRALLAGGVPIGAVNAVRKHLSALKGGGALRLAARVPRVLALLLSDVPGDEPGTIASGPFAADPTTFADALSAVTSLSIPERARQHLEAGAAGGLPETLKPGDPALGKVETLVVGSAATAVAAVVKEAQRSGFQAAGGALAGEAAEAARALVSHGRAMGQPGHASGVALVLGGETTVAVGRGAGRGGRNQELGLAAAREIAGRPDELVLTLATDGEDGPTRAAGAIVDGGTWEAVAGAGIDPHAALQRHDSATALAAAHGALLETGPTGTNVGDLAVYLRWCP